MPKNKQITEHQISEILSMKKKGSSNVEIGKAFNLHESSVRYYLNKQKDADKEEVKGGGVLKMLQISTLRQGLNKALSKLDNALAHCGNSNEDAKLTIDIAKFYISALRFEQLSDAEVPISSAEQEEIDALVIGLLPEESHAEAVNGIVAIKNKYRKLEDEGGIIK